MKRILIADASKASLVMTSEVFKDHFPGVQVVVARTSAEAIELAKTCGEVDAFIIDFDLPDNDGAYTAAKIKKFSTTPILITGFDKVEVQQTIEQELAAYDDCLSWLKKPVKADLVVSVAQRFIEGRYRCQRRIACLLPALIEANVVVTTVAPAAVAAATAKKKVGKKLKDAQKPAGKATAKSAELVETKTEMRILIPVMLEDSSVGGVKIKVAKKPLPSLAAVTSNAVSTEWNLKIEDASVLTVIMPTIEEIIAGPAALEAWQQSRMEALAASVEQLASGKAAVAAKGKGKASGTLAPLQAKTTKSMDAKKTAAPTQTLKGRVAWQAVHDDGDVIGLQGDNPNNTKKLFETLIDLDQKDRAEKAATQAQATALAALVASQAKDQRSKGRTRAH